MQKDEHQTRIYYEQNKVLNTASLFEDEFSVDWVIELCQLKASQVISFLELGIEKEFLIRVKPTVYYFNKQHRGAFRNLLNPDERQQLHRNIAGIFIRELPDDENKPIKVAWHLLYITNGWEGCQWLMTAGYIHAQAFNSHKAITCFYHILTDLTQKRGENEDLLFIKAAIAYSDHYPRSNIPGNFLSYLNEAQQRSKEIGHLGDMYLIEMHLSKYDRFFAEQCKYESETDDLQHVIEKNNIAINRFNRAYAKAAKLNDPELIKAAAVLNIYFLYWQGKYTEVVNVYEKTIPDIQQIPIGHFPTLAAIVAGNCYTMVGQVTQGLGMLNTLRDHCLKREDFYLASHASATIGNSLFMINHFEESKQYYKLALKEAEASENSMIKGVSLLMLALIYNSLGEKKKATKYLKVIAGSQNTYRRNMVLFHYILQICWAMEIKDMPNLPGFDIEVEIQRMICFNNCSIKGAAHRYQALLYQRKGHDNKKITNTFALSLKWLAKSGHQFELHKTHFDLARHYLSLKKIKKAKGFLEKSIEMLPDKNFNLIPDDLRPLTDDSCVKGSILSDVMDITARLASDIDKKSILQHILAAVNRTIGAERGAIYLVDKSDDAQQMRLRASRNFQMEQKGNLELDHILELMLEVVNSGKGNVTTVDFYNNKSGKSEKAISSSICAPITQNGKIIGALYHDNRLLKNIFDESDLEILTFYANIASLAFERERLHEELIDLKEKNEDEFNQESYINVKADALEGIVGMGKAYQKLLQQIEQVADSDAAVLLTGETGVGKSLIAGAIHSQSGRVEGPFITVQCSALTNSLITSELFGHEKGAFTGAVGRHIGRFELAHNGTLFMDEIGDLSLDIQARLLRVLQNKEFERVGSAETIVTSDFRLIAATNSDLKTAIADGKFRSDLFYRINVFHIHIPPLRERKEDVPLLVYHFINRYAGKNSDITAKVKKKDMASLVHYHWPGNVRELENVVQKGLLKGNGKTFVMPYMESGRLSSPQSDSFPTFDEMSRNHINEALALSDGKIHGYGGAAELLGLNEFTLQSKMRKLGLKKPTYLKLRRSTR